MPLPRSRSSKQGRLSNDSLTEFCSQLRWTRAAPAGVRRAAAEGDLPALACALAAHLADRPRPRSLGVLAKGANPYLWSLAKPGQVAGSLQTLLGAEGTRRMMEELSGGSQNGRPGLLLAKNTGRDCLPAALALLCCADLHACQPAAWTPEKLLGTLEHLLRAAVEAVEPASAIGQADLANVVLCHGEVPWTMAVLWPEIRVASDLLAPARRALEAGLTRLCGREGVPHPQHLGVLPLVLASLCRCAWLAREAKVALWRAPLAARWRSLLVNALRLREADGRLPLAATPEPARASRLSIAPELDEELIEAVLPLYGDPRCRAAWAEAQGSRRKGRTAAPRAPAPSVQCDETKLSVLRPQWQRGGSMLVVRHDRSPIELELSIRGERVLSGPWQFQLEVDGKPLEAAPGCHAVCWLADKDVIYLELRMKWRGGIVLERQMLLGRREPFALLADAIKTRRKGSLRYTASLPLADGLSGRTDLRSRIAWVRPRGKRRIWLVPLGLEQWRVQRSAGALEFEDDRLRLHASSSGKGLYAPLFVHGYPRRAEGVDWRRLTVTQSRRIIGSDRAAAYRIRLGAQRQLLLYRTLGPRGTRAVLGHQTKSEFVFGWFDRDGEVEPLLEVT